MFDRRLIDHALGVFLEPRYLLHVLVAHGVDVAGFHFDALTIGQAALGRAGSLPALSQGTIGAHLGKNAKPQPRFFFQFFQRMCHGNYFCIPIRLCIHISISFVQ